MDLSELRVLIICFNGELNEKTIEWLKRNGVKNPKKMGFDYVDTRLVRINGHYLEISEKDKYNLKLHIFMHTRLKYFYDFIIYQKCSRQPKQLEHFLRKFLFEMTEKNLKDDGILVMTNEYSYPDFLEERGFIMLSQIEHGVFEFRKDPRLLNEPSEFEYKILIVCFSIVPNRRLLNYLRKNNIPTRSLKYDYIGSERSELNGEQIISEGGTSSKTVIEKVQNLPYEYDFIFYEHCPILSKGKGKEKNILLFSPYSMSVFKQKLSKSGKIVFISGERKYEIIMETFKPYNYKFEVYEDYFELSHK